MKIALIGANGQLGTDLLPLLGDDVWSLGHEDIEIRDAEVVESVLTEMEPDCVINTAAYNHVDLAEDEPERAFAVNALGPRNLSLYCEPRDIVLLHVSTDYVFGLDAGRTLPYTESDAPGPLGAYATSKLAGEYFVRSLCRRHFVVRTCGLYGHAAQHGKGNFVETMLKLAAVKDEVRVVDDQRCTPTSTAELARAMVALMQTQDFGLYHATCAGSATWRGFAEEIFRQAKQTIRVIPVTSEAFGAKAVRPAFSVLDNQKLQSTIGSALPAWQEALAGYLNRRIN